MAERLVCGGDGTVALRSEPRVWQGRRVPDEAAQGPSRRSYEFVPQLPDGFFMQCADCKRTLPAGTPMLSVPLDITHPDQHPVNHDSAQVLCVYCDPLPFGIEGL